jgi:hypothetical protein
VRWKSAAVLLAAATQAALAAPAGAAQPAELFNAPGQAHNVVCVHLAASPTPLRFADASATGFGLANEQLAFDEDGRCPAGTARLDLHEAIPSPSGPLVFHRGGNGYADEPNTKYGELAAPELADPLPEPVPSAGGRGAPCAALAPGEPAFGVDVESIPEEMHYKRPQDLPNGLNRGSSFEHYGDPGADQGDRQDIHYSYLLWSFLDVGGGGIVRTLLAPDRVVRPCDVAPVVMDSWDRDGNVNGQVTARYVRTLGGTCPLYGWMIWSHTYAPDATGPIAHATPAVPDPGPDPTADPACPVAAAAAPPTVETGAASTAGDGTSAMSATVNPEGVPTTYRFEYGLDTAYGPATPDTSVSAVPRVNTVTARAGGLQLSTTYHYRVVASSVHGASYGADRTFTMPDPPPPPPPPVELKPEPVVPPLALSGLAVSPSRFARARKRTGTPARIVWSLTRAAGVRLTFQRAAIGFRDGAKCRRAPKRGIPRGKKRCLRWPAVPGTLRQAAAAGTTRVRFGGWIGKRPLALGRYRVRAAADGAAAAAAVPRLAGFRIR